MDRRSFLKLMGGLAALPIVGKVFKFSKPAAKVAENVPKYLSEQGMPSFFYDIIAGVKKFGKQTKSERDYNVYEFTHPKTKQKVQIYDGPDEVGVNFTTDRESGATMLVRKGKADELTKGKKPIDEYFEYEDVYRPHGDDYYKDFQEEITGGYKGLADLAKKLKGETFASGGRIGLEGGGSTGQPPVVFQTNSPKEAMKEIIKRIPDLSGQFASVPVYRSEPTDINLEFGRSSSAFPDDPYQVGIKAASKYFGLLGAGLTDQGGIRAFHQTKIPNSNISSNISYDSQTGPYIGLQWQKQFANGGLTDTIPPKRGPMSQGVESLFIKR